MASSDRGSPLGIPDKMVKRFKDRLGMFYIFPKLRFTMVCLDVLLNTLGHNLYFREIKFIPCALDPKCG